MRKLEDIDNFLGKNTIAPTPKTDQTAASPMNLDAMSAKLMSQKSKAAATLRQKTGFGNNQNDASPIREASKMGRT